MRPRVSLRLILIAFAVLSVLLYVFVVRPTTLAERFVSAVSQQDFDTSRLLLSNPDKWDRTVYLDQAVKPDRIYAELMPREWQDVWRCRRRMILRVSFHNNLNGGYVDWTEDTDVVADPRGLQINAKLDYNFNWPVEAPQPPAIINPGEGFNLESKSRTG